MITRIQCRQKAIGRLEPRPPCRLEVSWTMPWVCRKMPGWLWRLMLFLDCHGPRGLALGLSGPLVSAVVCLHRALVPPYGCLVMEPLSWNT